jgi:hypothetical protein
MEHHLLPGPMNPEGEPINFAGMTVNERLFVAGLLDQWDDACRLRDRDAMIALPIRKKYQPPMPHRFTPIIRSAPLPSVPIGVHRWQ